MFYCGVWDDEGLAEAHDELDGEEEFEVEERLSLAVRHERVLRLGGLRPPAVVGRVLVRRWLPTSAMTGLGRERLSPWYDADYVFVCVAVWLCVFSRVGASFVRV